MDRITRRETLALVGLGLGAGGAGCLSDDRGVPATDGGSPDDPSEDPTDTPGGVDHQVHPFATTLAVPRWHLDERRPGYVELYGSEAAAMDLLALDVVDEDRRDDVESFVAGTDYETGRLLYVASVGPSTCYGRVDVEDVDVTDDEIVGAARAADTSDQDEGCGAAETFPSTLVRVETGEDPPNGASITVTDGWEDAETLTAHAFHTAPSSLPGDVAPDGEPPATPADLVCDDEAFTRHPQWVSGEPPLGTTGTGSGPFALRVDRTSVARGETVTVSLTNLGAETAYTGNRHKYGLHVSTEAGWQDVRGSTERDTFPYTDEAVAHEPGEGFVWEFELTGEGVVDGHSHEDHLEVCPDLQAGRYRFVLWEPLVAVTFDVA